MTTLGTFIIFWPHRLMVRTPAFQAENRGSIPRGATKIKYLQYKLEVFYFNFNGNRTGRSETSFEPQFRRREAQASVVECDPGSIQRCPGQRSSSGSESEAEFPVGLPSRNWRKPAPFLFIILGKVWGLK